MRACRSLAQVAFWVASLQFGCAHVQETRTREILEDESVRVSETERPELNQIQVRATLNGASLSVVVSGGPRCVVQFRERALVRERVRREPSPSTLAGEAVLMGVGVGVGIAARRQSSSDQVRGSDVLGVLSLAAGLGAGVALAIDGSRFSDSQSVREETTLEPAPRVVPCEHKQRRSPARVELRTPSGRRFVAPLDGFGRGRLNLPESVWVDGRADFDVWVDGVSVQRLIIKRSR
ncbi:MAG: hypothetical protein IPI67_02775 [Myxococcales bacterium]|nr:hypothetical protein [Myxococcales bacterium]